MRTGLVVVAVAAAVAVAMAVVIESLWWQNAKPGTRNAKLKTE
jgi:hypothetical protein